MVINDDIDVLSVNDEITEQDHSLNHSADQEASIHSKRGRDDIMKDISKWRKHAFNVILPRRLSEHTDSDLRLMLVSLKNAKSVSMVHILRIEKELKKRGCDLTILG